MDYFKSGREYIVELLIFNEMNHAEYFNVGVGKKTLIIKEFGQEETYKMPKFGVSFIRLGSALIETV